MANKADELLKQCLEIEGLLSLISTREDTAPDVVYAMLKDKVSLLEASVRNLCESRGSHTEKEDGTEMPNDGDAIAAATQLEEREDAFENTEETVSDCEVSDVQADDDIEVELVYSEELPDEMGESDMFVESPSDFIPLENVSESFESDSSFAEEPKLKEESESTAEVAMPATAENLNAEEDDDQEVPPVLSDRFVEFTLNDKFRFRRELFGNSDIDMNEALDVVDAMTSREEVEDYFYNDMCWDPNNEDVKDFIRIVTAKFTN